MADSNQARLWPAFTRPKDDELLSSWLIRLSHAHETKIQTFCASVWPTLSIWNRDIDKHPSEEVLQTLADFTPTPYKRVLETTLLAVSERLNGCNISASFSPWLTQVGVYHRTRRNFGLAYCPGCLEADGDTPYFRVSWRLAFYNVCHKCGIFLHDRCSNCGAPVMFFRNDIGQVKAHVGGKISVCSSCSFDLSHSPKSIAPVSQLRVCKTIYRIAREGWNSRVVYPHLFFSVLRRLINLLCSNKKQTKALQFDLSKRFGQDHQEFKRGVHFENMEILIRNKLVQKAMWLIEEWPDRFIGVMRFHELKSSSLLGDAKGDLPFWFDSIVRDNFIVSNVNRRFNERTVSKYYRSKHRLEASLNETVEVEKGDGMQKSCPKCASTRVFKNGFRDLVQRYKCRKCRGSFVDKIDDVGYVIKWSSKYELINQNYREVDYLNATEHWAHENASLVNASLFHWRLFSIHPEIKGKRRYASEFDPNFYEKMRMMVELDRRELEELSSKGDELLQEKSEQILHKYQLMLEASVLDCGGERRDVSYVEVAE